MPAFIVFAAGICCRHAVGSALLPWWGAVLLPVSALVLASRRHRTAGPRHLIRAALVLAVLFLAGMDAGHRSSEPSGHGGCEAGTWAGRPAWFTGRISRPPVAGSSGVHLTVDLDSAAVRSTERPSLLSSLSARLTVPAPPADGPQGVLPGEGERITFFATLRQPGSFGNPGAFDYAGYLRSKGITVTGRLKSHRLIRTRDGGEGRTAAQRFRDGVARLVHSRFAENGRLDPSGALLLSCLTGERRYLPQGTLDELRSAGLGHLLAISGLHIGLLGGLVAGMLAFLRLPIRFRRCALTVFFIAYHQLCAAGPSLTRAAVAAVLLFTGGALGLRARPLNCVAGAGLGILVFDPLMVHDTGFQFSFAATIAILVITPVMIRFDAPQPGRRPPPLRLPLALAAASFAVFVGIAPLQAARFNQATPLAVVTNIAAGPLLWATLAAGVCCLFAELAAGPAPWFVGILFDGAAAAAGLVVRLSARAVFRLARITAPFGISLPAPGPAVVCACYACLSLAWLTAGSRLVRRRFTAVLLIWCAPCLLVLCLALGRTPPPGDMLRVSFLDVGQGDSTIIECPDGSVLVIDGGAAPPTGTLDLGRMVVSPALWHHGIHHLEMIVLTHGHGDHAGGLAALIDAFRPRRMLAGRLLDRNLPAAAAALHSASRRNCSLTPLHRGMTLRRGGLDLVVLHPPPPGEPRAGNNDPNNQSLVLLLRHGGVRMLFTGDLEAEGERLLLSSPLARLARNCDVLKVGHHGAPDASCREWLEHVSPQVAVISAGRWNRFGHPDPRLAGRLAGTGCRLMHCTGRDGALLVLSDGRRIMHRAAGSGR